MIMKKTKTLHKHIAEAKMIVNIVRSVVNFKQTPILRLRCELKQPMKKLTYVQGQFYDKKSREYFYFIDHQGMLFLDDAKIKNFTSCFKDKKFLAFFFKRLKRNETGRYEEDFPFISPCGREVNFIRCDDRPVVFTHLRSKDDKEMFCYGHVDDMFVDFKPDHIFMEPTNGRVYHPAPEVAGRIGLVCSKLAIEFSKHFEFENSQDSPPTHFNFNGTKYELNQNWFKDNVDSKEIERNS